ncbi:MAG: DNA-binding protein [Desulfobacterales bacterium CG07_land_8_20_14_0_80_52_14]|nr:MAG: DNA-binding protein [Desulfobacterales bacterium CG23_combo_of_CG06-09_8_20_14_all_52_9]PIU49215.1 MAG: DNA-binding protein [Desulfobacterales bacterium CG07_land_8_20_14_0_80_52_14]
MLEEMMSTKQVAKYLGIHEKQVYSLVRAKRIPSTRITGKWVFPKRLIDEWIETHAKQRLENARERSAHMGGALLACGSNDPILDMLQTTMKKAYPEFLILSANTGSTEGLKALNSGFTDLAWSHLLDPKSGQYNIPFLPTYLPDVKAVVVNLFHRELGLIMAPENPFGIKGFEDLTKKGIRLINRQKGSGTRVLLDHHLKQAKIPSSKIEGYDKEVYTHFEVGLSILSKEANAGVATIAIAKLLGLPFIPIAHESFDMILEQKTFFHKGIQAFIEVLNSKEFRQKVEPMGAYDFKDSGKIVYSAN